MVKTAIENKQNLIVEGCYIPFDWRESFDAEYLANIRFICLAMTDEYVENHFDDIVRCESEIEKRITDPDYTVESVKRDNREFIKGFSESGESITLINTDYIKTIGSIL
jgi:hypothetical protein